MLFPKEKTITQDPITRLTITYMNKFITIHDVIELTKLLKNTTKHLEYEPLPLDIERELHQALADA